MGRPGTEYSGSAPGQSTAPSQTPVIDPTQFFPTPDSAGATGMPGGGVPSGPQTGTQGAFGQAFGGQSGLPLPSDYQAMIDRITGMVSPGPLYQQYMHALAGQPEPVHGVGGHLKAGLRGLAMKGLPGAIYGLADPSAVNWSFKQQQAQNLLPGVQAEEHGKAAEVGRAKEIAEMTGYDPITGQRTP